MKNMTMGLITMFGLSFSLVSPAADFDGDGTGDIAVFRASSGLWSARGVTQFYFGGSADEPVPGDYDGDGTDAGAIFRAATGLWAARGVTRVYFGTASDQPKPGDYTGDGTYDIGIFRGSSGLWAARGITRVYFGSSTDTAIAPGKPTRPGRLPVTGQTTVYRAGDDGSHQAGVPFRYEAQLHFFTEWVVIDHVTGLTWARDGDAEGCAWGQQTNWNAAIDFCNSLDFAGYNDWRLPNVKEQGSIIDWGTSSPAIDTTYFTNTKTGGYWSSTTHDFYNSNAWGLLDDTNKAGDAYLRAVRGP